MLSLRNLHTFPVIILIFCLQSCQSAPLETAQNANIEIERADIGNKVVYAEHKEEKNKPSLLQPLLNLLPSLQTVQNSIERAANYGSQMLGYGHEPHHGYDEVIVKDKPTLWDGHIWVPDFLTPLINAMPDMNGYNSERVVKGHDGRLGFRVAVPYLGDVQYIREYGPGQFTDKLGPGEYKYPSYEERPKEENDHYGSHDPYKSKDHHDPYKSKDHHYGDPKPSDIVHLEKMYQNLQNYPWNVAK